MANCLLKFSRRGMPQLLAIAPGERDEAIGDCKPTKYLDGGSRRPALDLPHLIRSRSHSGHIGLCWLGVWAIQRDGKGPAFDEPVEVSPKLATSVLFICVFPWSLDKAVNLWRSKQGAAHRLTGHSRLHLEEQAAREGVGNRIVY